ncbi:hypothetical protein [Streptomyces sp. B1I3]|uniref:hypothetical protein n=1 Tax=Streptomyces sp. B1I3 TaxID=3042264 RepID=UPI002788BC6A|nr:hypothetical protein [Streptomyces sp. B1I3]MDQ0795168.1 hypothetical protein [Streptomyces sp. B1I3]
MRMLLIAQMDTESANRSVAEGTMEKLVGEIVDQLKPEAAYFTPRDGQRSCLMVFDMQDSAQMPPLTEPLFRAGAKVSLQPVMNLDELRTGLGALKH